MTKFIATIIALFGVVVSTAVVDTVQADTTPFAEVAVEAIAADAEHRPELLTNCSARYLGDIGWSYCSSGTGQHQIVLGCYRPSTHSYVGRSGPWVGRGQRSYAQCPEGQSPSSGWVARR